jgi:lipoate-protein ligase A
MKYLDLTLPTPEENLACDEALLDSCEDGYHDEILRIWEHANPFVVLGYSNKAQTEANLDATRRAKLPVLRRCTGGGAVVQGPGCLNYSLILRITEDGPLAHITGTNNFIMQTHRNMTAAILSPNCEKDNHVGNHTIKVQGVTDLTLGPLKFSGNAQRRRRKFLLFHGTFLLGVDIELIERVLPVPSRQPDYRRDRRHRDFLTNLSNISAHQIKEALKTTWGAQESLREFPDSRTAALAANRYATKDWTFKF